MTDQWNHKIFTVNEGGFEALALEIFRLQANGNKVYRDYCKALGVEIETVKQLHQIPFLPISFFKTHQVITGEFQPEIIFESSGTTGLNTSRHYIKSTRLYEESFMRGFNLWYGDIAQYAIIALLPAYLERQHSSLVYMADHLIRASKHVDSGFYLDQWEKLSAVLQKLQQAGQPYILLGVSFALLELAERFPMDLSSAIIMETGGMKGRRREIIREELHAQLCDAFNVSKIHAEYGMTELLSQAYSAGNGLLETPPWMKLLLRDDEDPLSIIPLNSGSGGLMNVIDLANVYSCAFIATDDVGRMHTNGMFEVLGRRDGSDLRGCSLLVT